MTPFIILSAMLIVSALAGAFCVIMLIVDMHRHTKAMEKFFDEWEEELFGKPPTKGKK